VQLQHFKYFFELKSFWKHQFQGKIFKMQTSKYSQAEKISNDKDVKRLTLMDYSKAGILGIYDKSVKERIAHDKLMAYYRKYLVKLCELSSESHSSE